MTWAAWSSVLEDHGRETTFQLQGTISWMFMGSDEIHPIVLKELVMFYSWIPLNDLLQLFVGWGGSHWLEVFPSNCPIQFYILPLTRISYLAFRSSVITPLAVFSLIFIFGWFACGYHKPFSVVLLTAWTSRNCVLTHLSNHLSGPIFDLDLNFKDWPD